MNPDKHLEELRKQLKDAEVMYYKILGAIEALEVIKDGESKESSKESKQK